MRSIQVSIIYRMQLMYSFYLLLKDKRSTYAACSIFRIPIYTQLHIPVYIHSGSGRSIKIACQTRQQQRQQQPQPQPPPHPSSSSHHPSSGSPSRSWGISCFWVQIHQLLESSFKFGGFLQFLTSQVEYLLKFRSKKQDSRAFQLLKL